MADRLSTMLLRGLTVVLPIAATLWAIRWAFLALDGVIFPAEQDGKRPPGLGVLALLLVAFVVGVLATARSTKRPIAMLEQALERIPIVKLVYGTLKDFVDAVLGKRKRFDKPVLVRFGGELDGLVMGFVTREDLAFLGMPGMSAVYFPQSYNFGGNLLFLPRERLTPVPIDSGAAMSFVISGGVSTLVESSAGEGAQRAKPRSLAPVEIGRAHV